MTESNINLFESDQDLEEDTSATNEGADHLADLVGEGKRYRDAQALAKAVKDKDEFIERLKKENATARSALRGEQKIDEFLDKLKTIKTPVAGATNQDGTNPDQKKHEPAPMNNETETKGLTAVEVEQILERREAARKAENNLREALELAKGAFGANFGATLKAKAEELGVSQEYITDVAKTSPQAFARLVGAQGGNKGSAGPAQTVVNSAALKDNKGNVKNSQYYKELRKKIGDAEFFKPQIQNEIFRQVKALGDAF